MEAQNLFINDFYIYHFKKIKETQFECGPINIFTGANNSGKSSVLTAIHFFYSIWDLTISPLKPIIPGKSYKILPHTSKIGYSTINFSHTTSFIEDDLLFLPTKNLMDIAYSTISSKYTDAGKENNMVFSVNRNQIAFRIALNNTKSFTLDLNQNKFERSDSSTSLTSFYAPGLSGIPYEEIHYGTQYVKNQAVHFGTAGNVLRNVLWRIWQTDGVRESFLADIYTIYEERGKGIFKIVASSGEKDSEKLSRDSEFNELLEFKVKISYENNNGSNSQKEIPLNQMGVGFLQVMQILAYKHLYQPKVMLLDEPEVHLHTTLIKKLFQVLEGWAQGENPTQIFISTHSRAVLENLPEDKTSKELYRLFNVQDGDVISKEITKENIEDILTKGLGETLPDFSKKLVIVTEDQNQIINKLHSCANDLEVYPSDGPRQLVTAKDIRQKNKNIKILIHSDLDKKTETEIKIQKEKHNMTNINIWYTDWATLEGYWLEYENLKKTIEINYGTVDAGVLDEIIKGSEFNKYTRSEFARLKNLPQTKTAEDIIAEFTEGFKNAGTSKDILEFYLNESKKFCHKDSAIGQAIKNILNKVLYLYENQLNIQPPQNREYPPLDCPSLTQKIKELLGK